MDGYPIHLIKEGKKTMTFYQKLSLVVLVVFISPFAALANGNGTAKQPTVLIVAPVWITGGVKGDKPGTEFDDPNELGFDNNGNLWAGDVFNLRVQIYDRSGHFIRVIGGEGDGLGQFVLPEGCRENRQINRQIKKCKKSGPEAIRVNSDGKVFVVDRGGKKINVYSEQFEALRTINSTLFKDPTGLAIDANHNLYVADQKSNMIHQFQQDGTFVRTFQAKNQGVLILDKTETLALDEKRDRLFASSEKKSRVEVFQLSTGKYLEKHVGELATGLLPQPGRFRDDVEGIIIGNEWLLMSDEDNGRILIHALGSAGLFDENEDFAFISAFGQIGGRPGEFLSADGIAISTEFGLVAVADQDNHRIQVFKISDIEDACHKK